MKLSEVSEHNKDVTAEQIATRLVRRFEEGQRRSDGSMALHPNHERWYIADAYRLATIILGESNRRGWVCIRHRCAAHYDVPAQNANEASGSECGGCIAAERNALRAENEQLVGDVQAISEDYTGLRAENAKLRERVEKLEAAGATVLRGFDEGAFVRNVRGDHDPAWAIKLLPYLAALAALAACEEEEGS